DLSGDVGITVGSGDLNMQRMVFEGLKVQSGSGDLKIDGVINHAEIKVGSGDVDLIYRKAPVSGSLTIRSGSGDARILMPAGSKTKIDFQTGSGKLTTEFDQLQSAPYSISVTAGSGNLRIKKL